VLQGLVVASHNNSVCLLRHDVLLEGFTTPVTWALLGSWPGHPCLASTHLPYLRNACWETDTVCCRQEKMGGVMGAQLLS
jgi:hypothetical protein